MRCLQLRKKCNECRGEVSLIAGHTWGQVGPFLKDMGNTEYFKRKVEWERLREYCRVGVGQWLDKISKVR